MERMILALVLVSGCRPPPPEGELIDASAALQAASESLGAPDIMPEVIGVPWNCTQETPSGRGYGFKRPGDGLCVGGLEKHGVIYLMLHPDVRYSHVLCHEFQHILHGDGDHRNAALWNDAIAQCNAHVAATLADEDRIMR